MFRNPTTDLIVILVIVLLVLGPKRLPGLGKSLGQGMREFKDSITGESKDEPDQQQPVITSQTAPPPAPPAAPPPAPRADTDQAPVQDRGSAEVGSERNS